MLIVPYISVRNFQHSKLAIVFVEQGRHKRLLVHRNVIFGSIYLKEGMDSWYAFLVEEQLQRTRLTILGKLMGCFIRVVSSTIQRRRQVGAIIVVHGYLKVIRGNGSLEPRNGLS